ncbi:diguanylate cyclase (GGDEF) domain-containing protein [Rivularia sp. PCC 7116]|uniref:diguanylate cyclase domain-containing protein n=1 Tax=Rivularia sp. PCC 7116 TaxID=373994 RepID=UPI00029F01FC|nr:diguanylate cyclase [Rivularia sp. PCC 7116]AFY52762.1 diguanylate cyclase (GGDEF) domain-containing protein [Rivularia sp. PCC 7116]
MTLKSEFCLNQAINFQPLTVEANALVKDVITLLSQNRASCALIVENRKLIGIFTERDVVRLTSDLIDFAEDTIDTVMSKQLISITASQISDIFTILNLMRSHRIRHLPVLNELHQLIGIVTPKTIRKVFKPADMLRFRLISELMETQVIKASPTTNILDIALLMATKKISCVVITEDNTEDKNYPIGIITEVDIVRLRARGFNFSSTQAKEVMSTPLKPVQETESLWLAHQKMEQENIRRLVVIDYQGKLSGIITQTSLLRILDPIEMQALIKILQQTVDEQSLQLQQQNQKLKKEIKERKLFESALSSSENNYRCIAEKLEIANQQLQELANYDGLTGLVNRRYFDSYLQQEWKHSLRAQTSLSLIMCDVDCFKKYNDTYGHQAGDKCLQKVAHALKETVKRPSDLAARYGGEEFVILLPSTPLEGAITVAKRISSKVESLDIPHIDSDVSNCVTVSLGVASHIPSFNNSPETLIATADKMLYKAKSAGRNTVSA